MEYQPNNPVKYDNWIILLKELYEKNVKKYEKKDNSLYYNPMRWENGKRTRKDKKVIYGYCNSS